MNDLIEFLRARLDEDTATALAAAGLQDDPENGWGIVDNSRYGQAPTPLYLSPHIGMVHERQSAEHIVRWNPARVLREVEAKRVLLDDYERFVAERRRMMGGWDTAEVSPVLMAFAAVYADHPDYRPEWKPDGSST